MLCLTIISMSHSIEQATHQPPPDQDNRFQLLLAEKYCKQYHIVDVPALSFHLANKTCETVDLSLLADMKTKDCPIFRKAQSAQKRVGKNQTRTHYEDLKANLLSLLRSINACFSQKKFNASEIFEYEQIILNGFLKGFVGELRKECREKAQFLEFVWSETIHLLKKLLEEFHQSNQQHQKRRLMETKNIHLSYADCLEEMDKRKKGMASEIQKLHQMVEFLIKKLRMKKKEAIKIFKESQQLVMVVNEVKDKNIDLQIKYLDLTLEKDGITEKQAQSIFMKKKELLQCKDKTLKLPVSCKRRRALIEHELSMEGELNAGKIIEEMMQEMGRKENSREEIEANFENMISELEEKFQEAAFKLKSVSRNQHRQTLLVETRNRAVMTYFPTKQIATGTTYSDKLHCDLIESVGVNTTLNSTALRCYNQGTQYDTIMGAMIKRQRLVLMKTVQICPVSFPSCEKMSEQIFDHNLQEVLKRSSFLLKYEQKGLKKKKTADVQHVGVQTRNKRESDSDDSFLSSQEKENHFLRVHRVKSQKRGPKRPRETMNNISKSHIQNIQNITRKFSSFQQSEVKAKKPLSNFSQEESEVPKDPVVKILPEKKRKASSVEQKEKNSNEKPSKDVKKFRKTSTIQIPQYRDERDGEEKNFTSLSRKTSMEATAKVEELLVPRSRDIEKSFIASTQKAEGWNHGFDKAEIQNMLQLDQEEDQEEGDEDNVTQLLQDSLEAKEKDAVHNTQKRDRRLRTSFVNCLILKIIKPQLGAKIEKERAVRESRRMSIEPVVFDVRQKLKESTFQTRKLIVPIKQKNLLTIISSVYSKSLELIKNKETFKSFISPLYETMFILYGSLPKSEIYKKMINFIAQLHCSRERPLFRSFLFFLSLDDQDPNCTKITSFDVYLYMRLIIELSLTRKPISELQSAFTTLDQVEAVVPRIFQQENISKQVECELIRRLNGRLRTVSPEVKGGEKLEIKLNLFFCSKIIVSEMIDIKESLISNCQALSRCLFLPTHPHGGVFRVQTMRVLIEVGSGDKLEEVWVLKRVGGLANQEGYLGANELSTCLLLFKVINFDQFYMRVLIKFKIQTFEALSALQEKALSYRHSLPIATPPQKYPHPSPPHGDAQLSQQFKCMMLLHQAEKQAQIVTEFILGKQVSKMFSLSLMLLQAHRDKK